MAEIKIERKKSIWPWILAALVVLALLWAVFAMTGDGDEIATTAGASAATGTDVVDRPTGGSIDAPADPSVGGMGAQAGADASATVAAMLPIAQLVGSPDQFRGQTVAGQARVVDVPTDRGFWIEGDGQRIFAVIAKSPNMEQAIDVNTGQLVQLSAMVHGADQLAQIGGDIDPDTRNVLTGQQVFLVANAQDIRILEGSAAQ